MRKFLLLFALFLGISSAVSAFTVKDICKSYNYSGEVYQIYTTIPDLKEEDVDGWPMSKMSGTVTIEPLAGDTVVVKGLFPGANDLKALFNANDNTLTFDVAEAYIYHDDTYDYDYYLLFGTGEITQDADGYNLVDPVDPVVGKFDANGVLTVADWMLIDDYYLEPFVCDGKTVCTPAGSSSVSNIEVENAQAVYYNLQGQRVANPSKGIYIRRQGSKVSKVVL